MNTFYGILIPFLGTTLDSACVYFLGKNLNKNVQKFLLGFAASVWSLIIPSISKIAEVSKLSENKIKELAEKVKVTV